MLEVNFSTSRTARSCGVSCETPLPSDSSEDSEVDERDPGSAAAGAVMGPFFSLLPNRIMWSLPSWRITLQSSNAVVAGPFALRDGAAEGKVLVMTTIHRANDPLLQPFRLKHLTLKNRIMSTGHEPAYSEDGMPKDRYRLYHVEKAKGGIALTMTAGSAIVVARQPAGLRQPARLSATRSCRWLQRARRRMPRARLRR